LESAYKSTPVFMKMGWGPSRVAVEVSVAGSRLHGI
jgi:hypothetical protein